ncbi:HNH endonuclease signature motif containing protein [uncultured Arthrobacter sp.]|uniref:HNH endonuclease signature motif containing protein n=1 Tax=uncultured Arthrobacter sp. TaxID=114050 RepID=UPI002603C3FE|nr:HNH endonuclease signature motif containing protein [uncultured Arthrobacter sp.]
MTLEAELECSSVQADDYAWHDFLTERDFRPEDLWEFDCEARATGLPGPVPEYPTVFPEDPEGSQPQPGDAQPRGEEQQREAELSQLVWELVPSTTDDGEDEGEDEDADDGVDADGDDGVHPDGDDGVDADGVDANRAYPKSGAGLTGRVVLAGLEGLELNDASETLKDLAGLRSWIDAMEARVVSTLANLTHDDVSPRFSGGDRGEEMARSVAASEVALTLNIPERTATRLVDESVDLVVKHPATLNALECGSISRRHAVLIADESLGMPSEALLGFERALLDLASGMTVPKLARRARRLREMHHPDTLPIRKAKAVSERHVEVQPADDGMAWLHALLPAEQACGIYQRLTATARKLRVPEESRTLTQLRADVLTDLLTHNCPGDEMSVCPSGAPGTGNNGDDSAVQSGRAGSPGVAIGQSGKPAWQGITAHVNITVPVLALLDVLPTDAKRDNNAANRAPGSGCSNVDGNAVREAGNTDSNAVSEAGNTDSNAVSEAGNTDSNAVSETGNTDSNAVSETGKADSNAVSDGNSVGSYPVGRYPEEGNNARGLNQFAELEGYGPIDAETAARLAAHAPSFTRILTHPVTGSALDVGRETYRPPKHLQDWVRARDRTCRHPGCNRAAVSCEIDHTEPWARGGSTSHCNLACFCPKHHMYKSEGIFGYHQPEPGCIVVRTRAGTIRTSDPEPPF